MGKKKSRKQKTKPVEEEDTVVTEKSDVTPESPASLDTLMTTMEEAEISVVNPTPATLETDAIKVTEFAQWILDAPEASNDLTLQWYGEVFQPAYRTWLARGRELAK